MSLGKLIQKGRQDKGMTQKELATKICEKPQIVNEYEQGKGIPNNQIMIKIEKAIGIKLRGKDKGKFSVIHSITEHGFVDRYQLVLVRFKVGVFPWILTYFLGQPLNAPKPKK